MHYLNICVVVAWLLNRQSKEEVSLIPRHWSWLHKLFITSWPLLGSCMGSAAAQNLMKWRFHVRYKQRTNSFPFNTTAQPQQEQQSSLVSAYLSVSCALWGTQTQCNALCSGNLIFLTAQTSNYRKHAAIMFSVWGCFWW